MKKNPGLLPAGIVFILIVLTGYDLVSLEAKKRAAEHREAARHLVAERAYALEQQLAVMFGSVQVLAAELRSSGGIFDPVLRAASISTNVAHGLFFVSKDRSIALNPAIKDDLGLDELPRGTRVFEQVLDPLERTPSLLGPVKNSSGWILIARNPVLLARKTGPEELIGWAAASMELAKLLQLSGVDGLSGKGYEYQLSSLDPGAKRERIISGLQSGELSNPVKQTLHFTEDRWNLSIAPINGWRSWTLMSLHCTFVLLGALMAALFTYDMARKPMRLRADVAKHKRRLEAANGRLMEEIQQREELERQFSHADYHDAFTGLPNRRYFMNRLERSLSRARSQSDYKPAVIVLNIDRFKNINDSLGQAAGDQLLAQAARRFEACLRPQDLVVARLGGDEFAMLLFDVPSCDAAVAAAQRLQDALAEPFDLEGTSVFASASIGITLCSSGFQRADDLVGEAQIALSKARTYGRAQYAVFDPTTRDKIVDRMQRETDLRRAIERQEFHLNFQPIVCLETGRIAGMETLLRWRHPLEGLVPPDKFIPLAEETGLIVPITRWVVKEACRQAQAWREQLPAAAEFYLSVNLSGNDTREPDLYDFVAGVLSETRLPPGVLRFEVTEGSMITNVSAASELVSRLRKLGIPILLDDFGTGYSSLSYLHLFQFDYLKIDRSFVNRITADRKNSGIVRAIVHMAGDLGLKTIAEGIENAEIVTELRELGCNYGQGYYFSKPVEGKIIFERLLSQYTTLSDACAYENFHAG